MKSEARRSASNPSRAAATTSLNFDALTGETYRLERKLVLSSLTWEIIPGASDFSAAADAPANLPDVGGALQPATFYRIRVLP